MELSGTHSADSNFAYILNETSLEKPINCSCCFDIKTNKSYGVTLTQYICIQQL